MNAYLKPLAAVALLLSSTATLASSAISLITPGDSYSGADTTLGFEFSPDDKRIVTSLGVYDEDRDGLNGRAFVGLWDTDGNLLASVNIGSGTSGTLDGRFRYADITPYALTVGKHYVVGAFATLDNASSWLTGQGGTAALNLHLSYWGDRFAPGTSLLFPSLTEGTNGAWLGGNLLLQSGAVPEPATWALMIGGFGLVGSSMRRRNAATATA